MQFAGVTDVGRVRETNEDAYCLDELGSGGGPWLLAVADGVGGLAAGEVASRIAIDTVRRELRTGDGDFQRRLATAIGQAHTAILREGAAFGGHAGMCTTLTAVVVAKAQLHWGHVGDSRAYVLRRGAALRLLTRDHSIVGEMVAAGRLGPEAARRHPKRNLLTRALGMPGGLDVETGVTAIEPGDWLILATDGLTTLVRGEEIADRAGRCTVPVSLCEQLVELAKSRGGPDNITVVAAQA